MGHPVRTDYSAPVQRSTSPILRAIMIFVNGTEETEKRSFQKINIFISHFVRLPLSV